MAKLWPLLHRSLQVFMKCIFVPSFYNALYYCKAGHLRVYITYSCMHIHAYIHNTHVHTHACTHIYINARTRMHIHMHRPISTCQYYFMYLMLHMQLIYTVL